MEKSVKSSHEHGSYIKVQEIPKHIGEEILVRGWLETVRDQGKIIFAVLRDVSGKVQIIFVSGIEETDAIKSLTHESVIEITGLVKKAPQAPFGGVEIEAIKLSILSKAAPQPPIQVVEKNESEAARPTRLDYRWIDLRKPEKTLIFKVWTELERAFVDACIEEGFIQIHSPKLMSTPSEGGAEFFEVSYFDRKAYLAQSPQFYKQMAQAAGFEGVFEIGAVFRAESSFTQRHGTEFTGYDIEYSYVKSHFEIMELEERIIISILKRVKEKYGGQILEHYGVEVVIPEAPFPKLTMKEVKAKLAKIGIPSKSEGDISPDEERGISEIVANEYRHEFVFITDYPTSVRPFYHMRHSEDESLTKSFDLIWRGIEVTTGAQREHRLEILKRQATENGVSHTSIQKYLEFFEYGCPPHGGLGIGSERLLMQLLHIENVRDISFLTRDPKRLDP